MLSVDRAAELVPYPTDTFEEHIHVVLIVPYHIVTRLKQNKGT
jgi:hypothetical protein